MDNSKTAILMVFHSMPQAEIVKGLLIANGISCFLSNGESSLLNPVFINTDNSIRLHVLEKDLVMARKILTSSWE